MQRAPVPIVMAKGFLGAGSDSRRPERPAAGTDRPPISGIFRVTLWADACAAGRRKRPAYVELPARLRPPKCTTGTAARQA